MRKGWVPLVRGAGSRYHPPALATVEEFLALDVRVGTILSADALRGARTPSLDLTIDFGALGHRRAVVESFEHDEPSELIGLQIAAIVNLVPEQIAGVDSEARVLTVGAGPGSRALLMPERPVPDGGRLA